MKRRTFLLLVLLAALAATSDAAEESASKGKSVLRVETRLVEVNVVAQDSKGRAVTDLTRDDFKLFDNGKAVPIDVFSAISAETLPETTTLPPNTFSNRVAGAPPSVTVILLDGINTSFEDQTWARAEVVRFLEELKPSDRVAIFLLGEHLYVLQNFTSDPKVLLEVLKNAKARAPKELAASTPTEPTRGAARPIDLESALEQLNSSLPTGRGSSAGPSTTGLAGAAAVNAQAQEEAVLTQFEGHQTSFFMVDRVYRTVAALMAISNFLAQFPGRKNLIWVSASFPVAIGFDQPRAPGDTRDQVHFTPELQRAIRSLNNADLAVYPVDARGLVPMKSATTMGSVLGSADENTFYSPRGTMEELADHTGGRAFYNTNDLAGVMRSAVDDSQADYTLGFYPHNIPWDGKYHDLRVKVTRPGVRLRYRKGYYASLDIPANEDQTTASFNRALYSPLDSTGLGLTVRVQNIKRDAPKRIDLRIVMDPRNITLQDRNGDKDVALEMLFAQSGPDGKTLNAFRQTLTMRVAAKGLPLMLSRGLVLAKWVGLVDGATMLELVVRDPASGNIGSVRIPLGS